MIPEATSKSPPSRRFRRTFACYQYQQAFGTKVKGVTRKRFEAAPSLSMNYNAIGHGFTGQRTHYDDTTYSIDFLLLHGFTLVEWNGVYIFHSYSLTFLTSLQ